MYLLPVQWKYSEKRTTTVTDEKLGTHHCMAGTPQHQKQQNLSHSRLNIHGKKYGTDGEKDRHVGIL
jgi:hypothetical protein